MRRNFLSLPAIAWIIRYGASHKRWFLPTPSCAPAFCPMD